MTPRTHSPHVRRTPDLALAANVGHPIRGAATSTRSGPNANPSPGPVTVGVTEAPYDWSALEWATEEARARNVPLRIVHAYHLPLILDPYGVTGWVDTAAGEAAEQVAADAYAHAHSLAPDLPITRHVKVGSAPGVLRRAAGPTGLIVLGQERKPRRHRRRTVAQRVSRRTHQPTVTVTHMSQLRVS